MTAQTERGSDKLTWIKVKGSLLFGIYNVMVLGFFFFGLVISCFILYYIYPIKQIKCVCVCVKRDSIGHFLTRTVMLLLTVLLKFPL